MIDVVGHHFSFALTDGGEHISIGHGAQALIPGVVVGREVSVHIVILAQFFAHLVEQVTA